MNMQFLLREKQSRKIGTDSVRRAQHRAKIKEKGRRSRGAQEGRRVDDRSSVASKATLRETDLGRGGEEHVHSSAREEISSAVEVAEATSPPSTDTVRASTAAGLIAPMAVETLRSPMAATAAAATRTMTRAASERGSEREGERMEALGRETAPERQQGVGRRKADGANANAAVLGGSGGCLAAAGRGGKLEQTDALLVGYCMPAWPVSRPGFGRSVTGAAGGGRRVSAARGRTSPSA